MTAEGEHPWREDVGTYVLGHLAPTEREAFDAHIRKCMECAAEVRSLATVAALLPAADPAWLDASLDPPGRLADDVVRAVRAAQPAGPRGAGVLPPASPRRTTRRLLVAMAATVAVAAGLVGYLALRSPGEAAERFRFRTAPAGSTVTGTIVAKGDSIEVRLAVRSVPPGVYRMSLRARGGRTISSKEFSTGGAGNWNGSRRFAVDRFDAVSLAVQQIDGTAVLIADLSPK